MKRFFTDYYCKCNECQYVGRFINQHDINDIKWRRMFIWMMFSSTHYECPRCGTQTTAFEQIEHYELNEAAFAARDQAREEEVKEFWDAFVDALSPQVKDMAKDKDFAGFVKTYFGDCVEGEIFLHNSNLKTKEQK